MTPLPSAPPLIPAPEPLRHLRVIVNRHAGWVRRQQGLQSTLDRLLGARGIAVFTDDVTQMDAAVRQSRADGVTALALCGGDGTNLHLLAAIERHWGSQPWPLVALLAGGSVNTVARNLGADEPVPRRLARLLAQPPEVLEQPLLRVNGQLGFIYGSHMIARAMEAYYRGPKGLTGCALLTARTVVSALLRGSFARHLFTPRPVRVAVDGGAECELRLGAIVASVIPAPAVGLRATARSVEGHGFHLVGTADDLPSILRGAPRLWTGLPAPGLALDVTARQARLTFAQDETFTIDGDMFAGPGVVLECAGPLRLLVPGCRVQRSRRVIGLGRASTRPVAGQLAAIPSAP